MSRHRRGTGSIFTAGSSTLWIQYYVNGRPLRENTGSADRQSAADLLQKRIYEAKQGLVPEPSVVRKLTVANLYDALEREYKINERKSIEDLKARWKLHVAPFFGFMRPANVSPDLIDRYIDKRQQEKATNATINRELALLKRSGANLPHQRCTTYRIFECSRKRIRARAFWHLRSTTNWRANARSTAYGCVRCLTLAIRTAGAMRNYSACASSKCPLSTAPVD
jgi:hypothetical protein